MKRVFKVIIVSTALIIPGAIDAPEPEQKNLVASASEISSSHFEDQSAFFKNFRDPKRIYTIRYFS